MNGKLTYAQDAFLDNINQICSKFGLNNIMAQLYAILYLNNKPLSLDDMVDRLKISKGSASINIRALERYGAVKRVWVKGSRKDYYEAESNISKVIIDRARSMVQHRLSEFESMINSSYNMINAVESSSSEDEETIKIFKERLEELRRLHQKADSLFNLFNSNQLTEVM